MDWQQLTTLILALLAGAYLARLGYRSVRAFLNGKGGCESGCGKCAFSPPDRQATRKPTNVIALTDVRPAHKTPRE